MNLPEDFCEWLFNIMDIPFSKQMDWKLKHQRSPNEREYKMLIATQGQVRVVSLSCVLTVMLIPVSIISHGLT